MAKGKENWKQRAKEMRQESRQQPVPTAQLGFGQMPEIPGHYPHNPNNAQQLQKKLAYQQALKARQAWLNTGNRPGQNYPDLPDPARGSMDPNTTTTPGQPYTPPTQSPTIPYRGQNRHRGGGGQGGYGGGGGGGYPTVGLPQPQPRRHRNRNSGYPDVTY